MKKHKLVILFDDGEISGIERALVFDNVLDAEAYLLSTGKIKWVKFEPDNDIFFYEDQYGRETGKAFWAVAT